MKYTFGVIRSLTLVAALAFSASAAALAQHVPVPHVSAPHIAPVVIHAAPVVVHAVPVVAHPAPVVVHPVPVVPPSAIRVTPVTPQVAAPQAIPGRYPWRQWWLWNRAMLFQSAPLCWANSWGTWGMLASPTLGSTVSEEPFQVYDAYEYGRWGPAAGWPSAYGFAQSPCAPSAFTAI